MDERSGTIRLVEPAQDSEARGLVATVSRTDVEQAMRSEGSVDLLLDVERVTSDDDGRETQRIAATPRSATASEISTGVVAATPATPSEVSTGITAKPTATPVSADDPSWSPGTTAGVALAGTILALTAVGFAMRSRRGPRVAT